LKIHWWILIFALALGAYTYYGFNKFVECVTVHKDLPTTCLFDKARHKFSDQEPSKE
jgi:hypothetical protein